MDFWRASLMQRAWMKAGTGAVLALFLVTAFCSAAAQSAPRLIWSTDMPARLIAKRLSTPQERAATLREFRRLHIGKVYLGFRTGEGFGDKDRELSLNKLRAARDFFRSNGIEASALVATNDLPKPSTVPSGAACYTHRANRKYLAKIFQDAAANFNEIIIDDWFFTDCECSECSAAKGSLSWQQYRRKLMLQVSRDDILDPAHKVNPRVSVILKFPNWYDKYQNGGYEPVTETALYDRIWVGTETRNPGADEHRQQYGGFFLYRWLDGIGGQKTGGAWFDLYNTTPDFYVDQAYVSVLAGAPEIMLYSDSSHEVGSAKYRAETEALIDRQPQLDALAKLVGNWQGIAAYKPPSSSPGNEPYIFSQLGMLGIPLLPTHTFPKNAKAAFFADYALTDPNFIPELLQFFSHGGTAFVSQDLAHRLNQDPRLPTGRGLNLAKGEYLKTIQEGRGTMIVWSDALPALTYVNGSQVTQPTPSMRKAIVQLRRAVAQSVPLSLDAPDRVAVFPMGKRIAVMNFTALPVRCHLTGPKGGQLRLRQLLATPGAKLAQDNVTLELPSHGLLVMEK